MKLYFTTSARAQFLEGLEYIRQDNLNAATEFRIKTEKVLQRLEKFPKSGRSIPEFPELPHREVIISPYRFFYKLDGNIIWIVAVWHAAQLPESPNR